MGERVLDANFSWHPPLSLTISAVFLVVLPLHLWQKHNSSVKIVRNWLMEAKIVRVCSFSS